MSINPNSGTTPDPTDPYAGYGGYRASQSAENPSPSAGQSGHTGSQRSDPDYVYGHAQQGQQSSSSAGQQQQQQYAYGQSGRQSSNAYVPPESVSRGNGANQGAFLSQRERRLAFFSYLGFCFTGIVFFFLHRKNAFVRFHAAQSAVVFTPLIVAYLIVKFLAIIPLLGWLLSLPLSCLAGLLLLAMAGLWIFLMVTSYRGSTVHLPIVSDYAQALVDRFTKEQS